VGAVVVDAALFVPQIAPRLFVICVHQDVGVARSVYGGRPIVAMSTPGRLKPAYKTGAKPAGWIWWKFPVPADEGETADVIEENPTSTSWFTAENRTLAI